MQPYGGTEIQYDYLIKYASKSYVDSVQITTSIPEKIPLNPLKPNILWLKNSYDQPNLSPCLKIKVTIVNTIGMFLTLIGHMKSLDTSMMFHKKNL